MRESKNLEKCQKIFFKIIILEKFLRGLHKLRYILIESFPSVLYPQNNHKRDKRKHEMARTKQDQIGMYTTRLDQIGLDRTLYDQIRLDRTLYDQIGLVRTLYDQIGLDRTLYDQIGLDRTRLFKQGSRFIGSLTFA